MESVGIAQGKVSPPDCRDYLAGLIEERYGSRHRFCQETGVDPGHLSRVFASRSELSLQTLQRVLEKPHVALKARGSSAQCLDLTPRPRPL